MIIRMRPLIKTLFLFFVLLTNAYPQASWSAITGAPSGPRHDDITFINKRVGWAVNGSGQIWRTINGGDNWVKLYDNSKIYFRSIGFADSLHGWVGNLGTEEFGGQTDTNILFSTTNGGLNWTPVNNFIGPKPRGICGLQVIDAQNIVAAGRVRGPNHFIRSTDGGISWMVSDVGHIFKSLIDVHFFTPDSGFLIGGDGAPNDSSRGIIAFTSDGGFSWETKIVTSRKGEWCWKIDFPTRKTGYVSLQRNRASAVNFLKTTDGGMTWTEKPLSTFHYYVQGIGFANENLGWVGGNTTYPCYETTDGGETWHAAGFGARVNRFWMIDDSTGYAGGSTIYRYSSSSVTSADETHEDISARITLSQNYPNPFGSEGGSQSTIIKFSVPWQTDPNQLIRIRVFDLLGREVKMLIEEVKEPGEYSVQFDSDGLASGVYYYTLESGRYTITKKFNITK